MTARFDAFVRDLGGLCLQHGVRITPGVECCWVQDAEGEPFDDAAFSDFLPLSQEEREELGRQRAADDAAREASHKARHDQRMRKLEGYQAEVEARRAACDADPEYAAMVALVERDAAEQRKRHMRISRDPADKAYSTERAQVWVNDSEITDWLTADDFRRSVIARDGRVINGSVRIVILPPGVESAEPPSAPVAGHLLGVVEHVPDAPPPAPAPKPEERHGGKRRR